MKRVNYREWHKENGYTKNGTYEVSISLGFFKEWLAKKVNEYGLDLYPDFQRGHVWTEKQQKDFISFFLKNGGFQTPIFFNHPGWMRGYKGEFVIVDGLQRLTAILKFIENKIDIDGIFYKDFDGSIDNFVDIKININNLKTRKEVLKRYIEMNSGGTPHEESEIERVKRLLDKQD